MAYYTYREDSTLEKHVIPDSQSIFGPYKFKRIRAKILFQDKNSDKKYRDLYELSGQEHLSPNLFSSGTDSYSITTKLLDSNILLNINNINVPCFKFLQYTTGYLHSSKYYNVLYINKNNFLPCRIESYFDKELKQVVSIIFMKSYAKL